ncbi:LysR family transcriptional regulator [Micrococcales bacterium 31B]|nr:LysR family transcriptional regulator [Micrococcales bacterium 31B]
MSDFTLRQVEYFLACIDAGSLTRAAAQCHVSQTAISLALTHLEKALGTPLLVRQKSKGIRLTPAGTALEARCRLLLKQAEELHETASDIAGVLAGTLSLAVSAPLSPQYLPRILEHFSRRYPELRIEFVEGSSRAMQELVQRGEADCALIFTAHLDPGLDGVHLRTLRPEALVAAGHPFARRRSVSLREMSRETLILLDQPPIIDALRDLFRGAGLSPDIRWTSQNPETVRAIVGRGLAVSIVAAKPHSLLTVEGDEIRFVPFSDDLPANGLTLATPAGRGHSRKVRALAELLGTDEAARVH